MLVIRIEFFDVDGKCAVEILSSRILHGMMRCEAEDLTETVTDKIALLKLAGNKHKVLTIGKRENDAIYYVNITPNDLEELHENISSARQRRLAQSIQLEGRSSKVHRQARGI